MLLRFLRTVNFLYKRIEINIIFLFMIDYIVDSDLEYAYHEQVSTN